MKPNAISPLSMPFGLTVSFALLVPQQKQADVNEKTVSTDVDAQTAASVEPLAMPSLSAKAAA